MLYRIIVPGNGSVEYVEKTAEKFLRTYVSYNSYSILEPGKQARITLIVEHDDKNLKKELRGIHKQQVSAFCREISSHLNEPVFLQEVVSTSQTFGPDTEG